MIRIMFIDHRSSDLNAVPLCPLKLLEMAWLQANSCMQKNKEQTQEAKKGLGIVYFLS